MLGYIRRYHEKLVFCWSQIRLAEEDADCLARLVPKRLSATKTLHDAAGAHLVMFPPPAWYRLPKNMRAEPGSNSAGTASSSDGLRSGPHKWLPGITIVAPFSFVVFVSAVTHPIIAGMSIFLVW